MSFTCSNAILIPIFTLISISWKLEPGFSYRYINQTVNIHEVNIEDKEQISLVSVYEQKVHLQLVKPKPHFVGQSPKLEKEGSRENKNEA